MSLQTRLDLHVLCYKIVDLRISYGGYDDTPSVRNKLESQTLKRIKRQQYLSNSSELEEAQALYDQYVQNVKIIKYRVKPH